MNLSQIKFEAEQIVRLVGQNALTEAMDEAGECPGGTLIVRWNAVTGGTLNQSTGAMVGAAETLLSGTLVAVAVEEGVRTVVRQYAEIAVGDLMVTLTGNPCVELYPGQILSGTLPLSGVATFNPWFVWSGREYSQKEMSAELRAVWCEAVQGINLTQGILLKRNP